MSTAAPGDLYARGLAGEDLQVRFADGRTAPVAVDTWMGAITAADDTVLSRALAPVLDVGCGPGRHVLACAHRGLLALGVDISPAAVAEARRRGAAAVHTNVFEAVPGVGTWGSALLLDGNIGIGGHPDALLRRVRGLLRTDGRILVEVEAPGGPSGPGRIRLEAGDTCSAWFPWARVAADDVSGLADRSGLQVVTTWDADGRWFACLEAAEA